MKVKAPGGFFFFPPGIAVQFIVCGCGIYIECPFQAVFFFPEGNLLGFCFPSSTPLKNQSQDDDKKLRLYQYGPILNLNVMN